MSVYDPLGFLTPFMMRSRILLQKVWCSGVHWDDQLKILEFKLWKTWLADLWRVGQCRVPWRYIRAGQTSEMAELHIFCDANELAYVAVAYWRFKYEEPSRVALIASKR